MSKVVTSVALAGMIALSLVACSAPDSSTSSTQCDATPAGALSSSIKVSGEFGKEPNVTLPDSFEADTTERSVLITGDGEPAVDGQVVTAHYGAYNANTGSAVELDATSTWAEGTFIVDDSMKNSLLGVYKTLKCAHEGDRIVSAIPSDELFGALGVDMTGSGIGPTDTVVFIFDVNTVAPAPAEEPSAPAEPKQLPTPSVWEDNVPTVDVSGDIPVVTVPDTAPPAELLLKVITEGDGAVVADQQASVTVDYQGISWDTGEIFDQSYTRGAPATFPVGGVIDGFAAAMIGHKVGSTLLVTMPPASGYGEGEINDTNLVGQTLVFLIQIRDVQ